MGTTYAPRPVQTVITNDAMIEAGKLAVEYGFGLSEAYEHTRNSMEAVYVKTGQQEYCELTIENIGRGKAVVHRNDYNAKNDSQTFYANASAANDGAVQTLVARKIR